MAARRLIMVMLGLLGLSILISFFVPNRADRAEEGATGTTGVTSTTGPTGDTDDSDAPGSTPPTGTVATAFTVNARSSDISVCAEPGWRLVLTVRTTSPIDLSIPDFGRTASATRYAPAVFDLLMPEQPGRYSVEVLQTGHRLATIVNNRNCGRGDVRNRPLRIAAGGGAHDLERRTPAGPDPQGPGALPDQDLEAVDRLRPTFLGGGEQGIRL